MPIIKQDASLNTEETLKATNEAIVEALTEIKIQLQLGTPSSEIIAYINTLLS